MKPMKEVRSLSSKPERKRHRKLENELTNGSTKSAWESKEQDYELEPRNWKYSESEEALPIKEGGKVRRVMRQNDIALETRPGSREIYSSPPPEDNEPMGVAPLVEGESLIEIKEKVAKFVSQILEDPEMYASNLNRLCEMTTSESFAVSLLAIMALVPAFKGLAPSYRIRELTEAERREKVSRDVQKARTFEQNFVNCYHSYIKLISDLSKVSYTNSKNNDHTPPYQIKLGQIAINAACELAASSLKHFNYREELFAIVIRRLNKLPSHPIDLNVYEECVRLLESLLLEDSDHGVISWDVVRLLTKSIKSKAYRVDETVVNIFLSLSILDHYQPHARTEDRPKISKKARSHLSKKERKVRKELKKIDDEFRRAQDAITAEEKNRILASILKAVFSFYLGVIQQSTESRDAKALLSAVLEGLTKFSPMANLDLVGDFLEVLRELMSEKASKLRHYDAKEEEDDGDEFNGIFTAIEVRELLLTVSSAFALVVHQSDVSKLPTPVDLSRFVEMLYRVLTDVSLNPDLELSHRTFRLADPSSQTAKVVKPSVNVSTTSELLLNSLDFLFFRSGNGNISRAFPFVKRLYLSGLHCPEKTLLATLKFIGKLCGRYGESLSSLWSSAKGLTPEGDYIYGFERSESQIDCQRSNSESATLWENALLEQHYCPAIRDGVRSLGKRSRLP